MVLALGRPGADGAAGSLAGDALVLLSVLFGALGNVAGGRLQQAGYPAKAATLWSAIFATALLCLALPWAVSGVPWQRVTPAAWAGVAYLALGVTILGYSLWYWALGRGGIARVGLLQFLQPVSGVLLAGLLLGERLAGSARVCAAARQRGGGVAAGGGGADLVMNPAKEDVVQAVKDLTEGYGCDVYIEATGHPSSVVQGLNMIRKLGRFVEFSVFGQEVTADWSIISDRKQLDLYGAHLGPYCYPFTTAAINDGRLPTEGVVTTVLPLAEFKQGFDMMKKGEGSIKIVLTP